MTLDENAPSDGRKSSPCHPLDVISALWREVLQSTETPSPNDNFFAQGGDSMAMVTLEFRIHEELGVSLSPGAILTAPTLDELVTLVNRLLQQAPVESDHGLGNVSAPEQR